MTDIIWFSTKEWSNVLPIALCADWNFQKGELVTSKLNWENLNTWVKSLRPYSRLWFNTAMKNNCDLEWWVKVGRVLCLHIALKWLITCNILLRLCHYWGRALKSENTWINKFHIICFVIRDDQFTRTFFKLMNTGWLIAYLNSSF